MTYELIQRHTSLSKDENLSVETSLFKSQLTGFYVFEQLQQGTTSETHHGIVSLTPETIKKFMPMFQKIIDESSSSSSETTTKIPIL